MPAQKVSRCDGMDAAVKVSPLTVLVRGVLEWMLPSERLQALHEQSPRGWTRKLTIEAVFWLVVQVVSGAKNSVFAAYQADQAEAKPSISVSHQAVYDKLARMPPAFGTSLVRESAARAQSLLVQAAPRHYPGLKNYRIVAIDGTDLGGSEHRLDVLRRTKAAGLPGRFVVAYDWATGICCDAVASEDAYTSERTLVPEVLARAGARDLFVMDRYYCTTNIMRLILERRTSFVVREKDDSLRCRPTERPRFRGRVAAGKVYEQSLEVEDTSTGETFTVRRVILKLAEPTTEGDTEIRVLTNLPAKIPAVTIAEVYRERWTIESHFNFLKHCLHGEVESLGKPRAALFMMFLALVTSNALAVVRQAVRTTHGDDEWERLSGYYLADELAKNYHAVDVLIEATGWREVEQLSLKEFWNWTQRVVQYLRPAAFYKHPRGPKLPAPPKTSGKHRHHYSTFRLLRDANKKP
jgi:IS4 transposase